MTHVETRLKLLFQARGQVTRWALEHIGSVAELSIFISQLTTYFKYSLYDLVSSPVSENDDNYSTQVSYIMLELSLA